MKQVRFVEPVHHRKSITSNTRRTFEDSLTRILNKNVIQDLSIQEFETEHYNLQDRFVDAYTIYIRLYPKKQRSIEQIIRKDWKSFKALFLKQLEPVGEDYDLEYIQTIHVASKYYPIKTLNINFQEMKASPELHRQLEISPDCHLSSSSSPSSVSISPSK